MIHILAEIVISVLIPAVVYLDSKIGIRSIGPSEIFFSSIPNLALNSLAIQFQFRKSENSSKTVIIIIDLLYKLYNV